MYLAGRGIDKLREGVDVGRQQLAHSAYLKYEVDERMGVAVFFKHFLGGGVCAAFGALRFRVELQTLKQHFSHLRWRPYVEGSACKLIGVLLHLPETSRKFAGKFGECLYIDSHSGPFHVGKYRDEGQLYVGHQVGETVFIHKACQHVVKLKRDVGNLAKAYCLFALWQRLPFFTEAVALLIVEGVIFEISGGNTRKRMAHLRFNQIVCH